MEKKTHHKFHALPGTLVFFLTVSILSSSSRNVESVLPQDSLTIEFGGRTKVNCHSQFRNELNKLFGETLGLRIEWSERYDRVHFSGDGFVAFVYSEAQENLLTKAQFVNAMQVGLLLPENDYKEAVRRMKANNADEYFPPYFKGNQDTHYYFHAPGGQYFDS